jgi:hypothetical protein
VSLRLKLRSLYFHRFVSAHRTPYLEMSLCLVVATRSRLQKHDSDSINPIERESDGHQPSLLRFVIAPEVAPDIEPTGATLSSKGLSF